MSVEATSARCPEHPAAPSVGTCSRCGRFLCADCVAEHIPVRCRACSELERQRDLLGARPFSFGGTLSQTASLISASFAPLALLALLMALLLTPLEWGLLAVFGPASARFVPTLLALAAMGFYGAAILVVVRSAKGEPVRLGQALAEGYRAWGRIFAVRFQTSLVTGLFMLLLVIPGLLRWAQYCVAIPVVMLEPNRAAVDRSTRLTQDRRWQLLATLLVTFLPVLLLSVFGGVVQRKPMAELASGGHLIWLLWLFAGRLLLAASEMLWWTVSVALYSGLLASEQAAWKTQEPLPAVALP